MEEATIADKRHQQNFRRRKADGSVTSDNM